MDECMFPYICLMVNVSLTLRELVEIWDYRSFSFSWKFSSFTLLEKFLLSQSNSTLESIGSNTTLYAPEEVTQFQTLVTGDGAQILSDGAPWKRPAQLLCSHLEALCRVRTFANEFCLRNLSWAWCDCFTGVLAEQVESHVHQSTSLQIVMTGKRCQQCISHHNSVFTYICVYVCMNACGSVYRHTTHLYVTRQYTYRGRRCTPFSISFHSR